MLFYPFYFSAFNILHNLLDTAAIRTFNSHEGLDFSALNMQVQFSHLVILTLHCVPHELQRARASWPTTNSQSLLKLTSVVSVMPSSRSHPLSSPSRFILSSSIRVLFSKSVLCTGWGSSYWP